MKLIASALILTLVASVSLAAQDAVFRNDVKQYITTGDKTKDVKATLTIGADAITVTRKDNDSTVIPFAELTSATYDRRAKQRKMLGLPVTGQGMAGAAQKVQHFLTLKYTTGSTGDFVELELGKDIAPRIVSILEARSGKPVEKIGG